MRAIPSNINIARCRQLIQRAIDTFELDLSGLVILTEAATGYYLLTPFIAAIAGADRVFALTRDSRLGTAQAVCERTMVLAKRWGVADQIEVFFSREDKRVGLADIVTNLGLVRPLDASFLRRLKPTAVIPLMFETWEYRTEDLDLEECRRLGIPVLGTNEHHPDLEIFQYVGHLVLKLLFELDIEVYRARIVVVGGGEFGNAAVNSLQAAGAIVSQVRIGEGESLSDQQNRDVLAGCDAVILMEHNSREMIIGPGGQITASELRSLNPGVVMVLISGGVDPVNVETAGIPFRPSQVAPAGYMSIATDYLGPRPLIDLHAGGLKVGELMARARLKGLACEEAKKEALKNPIGQDFSVRQREQHGY